VYFSFLYMSELLSISDTTYIPSSVAGKRFGYTKEYILMLVREGKIAGQKIGNKWFIDPESAATFFKNSSEVKKTRSEMIRKIRRAELAQHTQVSTVGHHRVALVETFAILLIGLAIGTTGYFGSTAAQPAAVAQSDTSFLERLALKIYSFVSPREESRVTEVVENANTENQVVSETPAALPHESQENSVSIVIAPADTFTASSIDSIKDSLSDEVTVSPDPANPDTGIITPHFKNGDGEAYRYLLVPVQKDTTAPPGIPPPNASGG
jgi:hypothetical protein